MGNFRKPGGFGGGRDFKRGGFGGGRPSFGGDRGERSSEKFTATCADCQKSCEVPFRPNGKKPVYCNDCFSSKREGGPSDFGRRDRDFGAKRDFAPRSNFSAPQSAPQSNQNFEAMRKQLDVLTSRIDKLMSIVVGNVSGVAKPVEISTKNSVEKVKSFESIAKPTEVVNTSKKDKKSVALPIKKEVKKVESKKKTPAKKK